MQKSTRTIFRRLLEGLLLTLLATLLPLSAHAGPDDFRAKINRIDTTNAPELKVRVTFLDDRDVPINPRLIDLAEVKMKRDVVYKGRPTIWKKEPNGTDVIFVFPSTSTVGSAATDTLSKSLEDLVKPFGKTDKSAMVTYNRAVVSSPLSADTGALDKTFSKAERGGARPFMFSALDEAISKLETSSTGRKHAIIFVGDGTDASAIEIKDLNEKLKETVERARKADVQIFTIGYSQGGIEERDSRALRILSRKTGATYRKASGVRDLKTHLDSSIGEIFGELIFTFDAPVEEQKAYDFKVRMQSEYSNEIVTEPYNVKIDKVAIPWILYSIIGGICCILSIIGFALTAWIISKWRAAKRRRDAEVLLAELLKDRQEHCEVCNRVQKPEWEECPFCAADMEPLPKTALEPLFVYDEQEQKLCNTCGRVCAAQWNACAFCAQGAKVLPEWKAHKDREKMLVGDVDPAELAKQAKEKADKEAAEAEKAAKAAAEMAEKKAALIAAGGFECDKCKNVCPPGWTECLYCAGMS